MQSPVVYYEEFTSTVSDTNCTFSFQKKLQAQLQEKKNAFLMHCMQLQGISLENHPMKKSTNGKPFLDGKSDCAFNLSHTIKRNSSPAKGCIVLGFDISEVGVDAEYLRPLSPNLAKKICSDEEYKTYLHHPAADQYLIKLWTLKEAYSKFTGDGIKMDFSKLYFTVYEETKEYTVYHLLNHPDIIFYQYAPCPELWISICMKNRGANAPALIPVASSLQS